MIILYSIYSYLQSSLIVHLYTWFSDSIPPGQILDPFSRHGDHIYRGNQSSTVIVKTLSEKHAVSVIMGIYDNGEVRKMQIMDFGPSINTIDALLNALMSEGLVSMREEMKGRRTFYVSLTEKGKKVGKKLDEIRNEVQ